MEDLIASRLTWLVGPPGAGKSTLARALRPRVRVVELTDMLGPLVNPMRLRKGVLAANGMLVRLIRHLELHPENRALPPIVVVAGLVDEDALFPLEDPEESVWLVLPPRDRWLQQLHRRPVGASSSGVYDDYDYAARWYDRFATWIERGLPLQVIEPPLRPELIGAAAT